MIDALRPWIGIAFGAWLMLLGFRWAAHPNKFVGSIGYLPATVPRTVRGLGLLALIVGAATIATHISHLLSE